MAKFCNKTLKNNNALLNAQDGRSIIKNVQYTVKHFLGLLSAFKRQDLSFLS